MFYYCSHILSLYMSSLSQHFFSLSTWLILVYMFYPWPHVYLCQYVFMLTCYSFSHVLFMVTCSIFVYMYSCQHNLFMSMFYSCPNDLTTFLFYSWPYMLLLRLVCILFFFTCFIPVFSFSTLLFLCQHVLFLCPHFIHGPHVLSLSTYLLVTISYSCLNVLFMSICFILVSSLPRFLNLAIHYLCLNVLSLSSGFFLSTCFFLPTCLCNFLKSFCFPCCKRSDSP